MTEKQFVVFATPSFDHNVTIGFHSSAAMTYALCDQKGIGHASQMFGGDPYLAKVRNLLVATCLEKFPQMTDFFFLDADIQWDPAAAIRLIEHPADVVAGVYPKKNDTLEFPVDLEVQDGKLIERDGWYKARAVPTGFLRIKRHVLDKMAATAPRYKDGTGGGAICPNIFEMGFCPDNVAATGLGEWWGEDFAWCRKWHDMGGEIWVYPDIAFGHRGGKTWFGNFADSVKAFETSNVVDIRKDSAA